MDDIADSVNELSLNAKEWRPGLGFAPTPKSSSSAGVSADGACIDNNINNSSQQQQQAVDVNGTHFFGSAVASTQHSNSWEGNTTSGGDSSSSRTQTTTPSYHYQQTQQSHTNRPSRSTLRNTLSLPSEEYHFYRELTLQSQLEMHPNDDRHKEVPTSFCRAYCLDEHQNNHNTTTAAATTTLRSSFGYPTRLFRVTSTSDGNLYCLRRMDSVRCVNHKIVQTIMHQWLSNPSGRDKSTVSSSVSGGFDHPGIVRWYKCFISQRALFFVHNYHAGAVTFKERFFNNSNSSNSSSNTSGDNIGSGGVPLPESFIWSCVTQLVSAIAAVHGSNLAVRTLQLNHILCTQEGGSGIIKSNSGPFGLPRVRLRINCVGIVDILEFEARKTLEELQRDDMRALGCILLSMTTGTEIHMNDIYRGNSVTTQGQILIPYFDFVRQNYSRELFVLIHSLLNPGSPPQNVRGVASSMAMRAFEELDEAHTCIDNMDGSLVGIYESGRALRLLLKLAFVNERPEFGIDKNWSESG
jgi:PAB-dependent poly(A)-specific ribonuclease subunit 3